MTALKVLGIILLAFLLLSFLRIGVIAVFGAELCVRLRVGPLRLTVLPKKEKKPKKKKKADEPPAEQKTPKEKKKRTLPKPTLAELRDLAGTLFGALRRTLRRTCRRTRIDPLELCVILAGDDPADTAQTYGYACAALWTVMPKLEELFYIPNPSIRLDMDFQAKKTTAEGTVGVSLRVCDLFAILFTLILPMAKWLLHWRKAHRNDPKPAEQAGQQPLAKEPPDLKTSETEQLSA